MKEPLGVARSPRAALPLDRSPRGERMSSSRTPPFRGRLDPDVKSALPSTFGALDRVGCRSWLRAPLISKPSFLASRSPDVAIVGAGVIGLAVARRLAAAGRRVVVLDRGRPGAEASFAAAGMLCPLLEFDPSSALSRLGVDSLALYPSFAAEIEEETGISIDLRLNGVVNPTIPEDGRLPPRARLLESAAVRELEPSLSPTLSRVVFHEDEGSVDNRALTSALLESCSSRGVNVNDCCPVRSILSTDSRVSGLVTEAGDVNAPVVINTAGAWASQIDAGGDTVSVRPIKGQMILLEQDTLSKYRLEHTIYSNTAYVVPRSDGRVVVGTTVEDCGFDKAVDDEVVARLHDEATRLVPGFANAPVRQTWAGLRPRGVDEMPLIGQRGRDGYFVAVGHYRNGILLTPLTAELLTNEILASN